MRTISTVLAGLFLATTAQTAFALDKDGRFARPGVVANLAAKGLSTNVRVHAIKDSRSGKSVQVVAATKASGTVRAFNVDKTTGTARMTETGIVPQGAAAMKANLLMRRDAGVQANKKQPGTFAGINYAGLTARGDALKFNSKTDRHAGRGDYVLVGLKTGQAQTFRR